MIRELCRNCRVALGDKPGTKTVSYPEQETMATETQQAFNLHDEVQALQSCQDVASWRQRVDHNLQYFTREYIVEENITRYSYGLKRGQNGLPNQIYSVGYENDGDILNSFNKGIGIRTRAECIGFTKIEKTIFAGELDNNFFIWHSPPGKSEDGFKDHNFTFIGQVLESRVEVVALRNKLKSSAVVDFFNQYSDESEKLNEEVSAIDFLKHPVFVKGSKKFTSHMDIIRTLDPDRANIKEGSCRWLLDKLQPFREDILHSLEGGRLGEAAEGKIAHDNYALALIKGEAKEENQGYEKKSHWVSLGAPTLRGSCGFSGKIGGEAMTWNGAEEAYFECPKCQGNIPKGQGITVCPHCGARKEDYKNCD